MNKKTIALTEEQYNTIIETLKTGFLNVRPNERVATALTLEANLGIRISDIVNLRLDSFVFDSGRYRLNIKEQKTGKERMFTVPIEVYNFIKSYCYDKGIRPNERIFNITVTAVQKQLRLCCDYLGYENISTHSFRKFFATSIYKENGYNIVLVQKLLNHSSSAVTQRYIGISEKQIEDALAKHIKLV